MLLRSLEFVPSMQMNGLGLVVFPRMPLKYSLEEAKMTLCAWMNCPSSPTSVTSEKVFPFLRLTKDSRVLWPKLSTFNFTFSFMILTGIVIWCDLFPWLGEIPKWKVSVEDYKLMTGIVIVKRLSTDCQIGSSSLQCKYSGDESGGQVKMSSCTNISGQVRSLRAGLRGDNQIGFFIGCFSSKPECLPPTLLSLLWSDKLPNLFIGTWAPMVTIGQHTPIVHQSKSDAASELTKKMRYFWVQFNN